MRPWAALVAVLVCGLTPGWAAAQSPTELLQQGIRAYRELEFDAAAGFLRQSLTEGSHPLQASDRAEAMTYLAAAEVFRGNPDSAKTVFRELVLFDVRYEPDRLVFPPEVTNVYDRVRLDTKVVTVATPDLYEMRPGSDEYSAMMYSSSFHRVRVTVQAGGGDDLTVVYRGPIVDSLEVRWDGLDGAGRHVETGSYWLAVASIDSSGSPVRTVRVPLRVRAEVPDTLPHPPPPADSLFLPEINPSGPGVEALAGGLLIGGALALLPGAVAADAELGSTGYVVGGMVSLAGIVGFFTHRPGRQIVANIDANAARRRDWQQRVEEVARLNAARLANVRLVIRSGPARIVEHRGGSR